MIYSVDLRERAIELVDSGKKKSTVALLLKLSRRVIYLWLELREKTGDLKPKSGYQKGHSHRINDWKLFEKFAHQNKDSTTEQMAKKWSELTSQPTSDSVIGRGLKKIGFTFKKKRFIIPKRTKKREQSI